MSRGRKPKNNDSTLNWEQYFRRNVGQYLENIIIELSKIKISQKKATGLELLDKIKFELEQRKKRKILPHIEEEEIPFAIPENWVWCRLGDIIEFTDNLNIESALPKDALINYVDIDAIDNKNYEIRESKLRTVGELSSRARRVLLKGYIVYSMVRPYLNNIAIIKDEKPNYIGSTGFAVFNGILVDNRFLKYFLLTNYVRSLFMSMFSGFNSPSITHEQFISTLIPLPPFSEQINILNFLTDLESNALTMSKSYFNQEIEQKIVTIHKSQLKGSEISTELTHQLSLVKKLRQQLLQDAVQGKLVAQSEGDEHASELLKRIKAEREQLVKKKKLKIGKSTEQSVSLIDEVAIPTSWQWCKADEILFITKLAGFEYTEHISLKASGEVPVVRAQNVRPLNIDKTKLLYINRETSQILERCALTKTCLLVTFIGAGIGDVATFDERERWHLAPNVAKMEPFDGCEEYINVKYLNYFLMSKLGQKEIFKHIKATAQPSLSMGTIRDVDFAIPPLAEQKRIVQKLDELMGNCDALQESVKESAAQNEKLLQQVLREALRKEEVKER